MPSPNQYGANIIRVRTKGVANGVSVGNRFFVGYGGPGGPTAGDLSTFAAAFEAAFMNRFGSFIHNEFTLEQVIAEDLLSDTANSASWSGTVAGTAAGDMGAQGQCYVISWGIARRYRGGKPRTYIGPVSVNDVPVNNFFTVAKAQALATAAVAFQTDIGGMGNTTIDAPQLGVASHWLAKAMRPTPVFEPFTNVRVNQRPGFQRRRNGKLQAYQV